MITVNQTGYLPEQKKLAASDFCADFRVRNVSDGKYPDIHVGISEGIADENAGGEIFQIDFSELHEPGIYVLEADNGVESCSFKIEQHVYRSLKNATLKALYFQRCGIQLDAVHAGSYIHPACHTGLSKVYGDEDEVLDIQGGWHDAGDFGRYVTPAAVAVAHLLYAYELFPDAFGENINIPESGNGIPDILNECRYELDWLLQMQCRNGSVYHKQTTMHHADFIMPQEDNAELYVFPASSLATADFAAVMCLASRVYEDIDPLFARDAVHAAALAGQWLAEHPSNTDFKNPSECNTGEYNDIDDTDERMWAFCELMRTDYEIKNESDHSMMAGMPQKMSRQKTYRDQVTGLLEKYGKKQRHEDNRSLDDGFGWADVSSLAGIAVIFDERNIAGDELRERMYGMLTQRADAFCGMQSGNGFSLAMRPEDFVWGSNMVVANRGMLLVCASLAIKRRLEMDGREETGNTSNIKVVEYTFHEKSGSTGMQEHERRELAGKAAEYEAAALEQLHYLCGRNAMDISYITGLGEKAFMHPHNRTCVADGIDRPVPGEVSGGPCHPPVDERARDLIAGGTPPMKCYADDDMCYSLNEIAIYWNTPVTFLAACFDR